MRWLTATSLTLLAALWPAELEAAAQGAVARVTGCGAPAMATFVTTWREPGLLAVTTWDAVSDPAGQPCTAPVLRLPRDGGTLLARVGPRWEEQGLAALELLPGQDIPAGLTSLAPAQAGLQPGHQLGGVAVLSDIDDSGTVHTRLARVRDAEADELAVSWLHSLSWPWLAGAPVVGDDGSLLGVLAAPDGARPGARSISVGAFLNLHYELRRPTPPWRYGIWIAPLRDDEDGEAFWTLADAIRRELRRSGLDPALWEIRSLAVPLEAPMPELTRQARLQGGSLNAALLIGTTADTGLDKQVHHRAALVQLARDPAKVERPAGASPSGAGRRETTLVMPREAQDDPRAVARAVVALATADLIALHPAEPERAQRSLERALAGLERLEADHAHQRSAMSRSSATAGGWARRGAATLALVEAELLLALAEHGDPRALDPERDLAAEADDAWRRALSQLPEGDCTRLRIHEQRLEAWLQQPGAQRDPAAAEALLATVASELAQPSAGACAIPRARLQRQQGRALVATAPPEDDGRAAIAAYEASLDTFSLVAHPLDWALTQLDLGLAWQAVPDADRAGALEAAIGAHRRALSTLDHQLFPQAWALGQARLGDALAANPVGDPFENRREALAAYEQALTVFEREERPLDWARARNGMGQALQGLPWQDPPLHLHQAIDAHQDALEVFTREEHPVDWALTQAWLGNAIRQLPGEQAADRFQGALQGLQRSIGVLGEQGRQREQADALVMLGDAWRASPIGVRADNLERAIEAYEQALRLTPRDHAPERWASTWQRLGQAYREQREGDRAESLTRAVEAFTFALQVHSAQGNPIAWEQTQGDLGVAQAWQYALDAQAAAPDSLEALLACAEAAMQEALLRKARRLPSSGEDLFAEASERFERAHQLAPEQAEPLDGLALALWYQGRYAEAAHAQAKLVSLRPDDAWAVRDLDLYRLRALLAAHPDDVSAWRKLAAHRQADGDAQGALDAWSEVVTLAPTDAPAFEALVALALALDQRERASQAIDRALASAPDDPALLGLAVRLHARVLMDLPAALAAAERRATLQPTHQARTELAMLLLVQDQGDRALEIIDELLGETRIDPLQKLHLLVLSMAAGRDPRELGAELLAAYDAQPPGATAPVTWALLAAHVDEHQGPRRADEIFALFELLQQPRDPSRRERLRSLLGR